MKQLVQEIEIAGRKIGPDHPPFVIAEVGINHEGEYDKAVQMVDAACDAGADCVKFQCHITEQEMIPSDIPPGKLSDEPLYDIIKRCELTEEEERNLQKYCADKGIIYLSTPFSREAANRLEGMGVPGYKIGSGECNNYPLLEHVAKFGKPMILSTGMNDVSMIHKSVEAIMKHNQQLILMHCTSMYPTPYEKVRLGAIKELQEEFGLPVGLSDHSMNVYTCLGAVALGAVALEKHFTITRSWPGPDVPISIEPHELKEMVDGSRAIFAARGGAKTILPEEQPVIDFAYASVVTIKPVKAGETFSLDNIWVKRPGTGQLLADQLENVLGKKAAADLELNEQLEPKHIEGWS